MNEQFQKTVTDVYSKLIAPIDTSAPYAVSFEGSQKPFEFFQAWQVIGESLEKSEHPSFLEIGAYKGLWAIAFFEWCKMNNKKGNYTTVTWMEHNPANEDLKKVIQHYTDLGCLITLIDANSQLSETSDMVKRHRIISCADLNPFDLSKFDLVLIDADHRYEGTMEDIKLYSPMGKVLVFHDIRPQDATPNCGVFKAIQDSNIQLDVEIACSGDMMGIGIKVYP
jgi:hypothetical protein